MNSFDVAVISFLNQFAHKSVRFDNLVVVVSGSELLTRRNGGDCSGIADSQGTSGDSVSGSASVGTPVAVSTALRNKYRGVATREFISQ
jgi:hypothetical protein